MRWIAVILTAGSVAAITAGAAPTIPNDDAAIAHALNRLSYGPRPGDVARVEALGLDRWIDQQLHPERIADDALTAKLSPFSTLILDTATLAHDYLDPAIAERRRAKAESGTAIASDAARPPRPGAPTAAQQQARLVMDELTEAKILRAVYGERQLEEVLVDFWFNHFNVFAGKPLVRPAVTAYERDVIRPHVLGRFRELLGAVAKSPAMLAYLDNWQNVDPEGGKRLQTMAAARGRSGFARRPALRKPGPRDAGDTAATPKPPRGLNENYARELMELHTLGVDGGYTQRDVVDVARVFTGWTIRPRQDYAFTFVPALHDPGTKTVLGNTIAANGGVGDGERVLDLLAEHPSTARHLATKLVRHFVSDDPPPALVDRVASRFRATHGDLREVIRTLVTSPEFFAASARRAKTKTPFEFVASALRAADADVRDTRAIVRTLRDLGMPPYLCQPPTGYDDTAAAWLTSGALVSRMNFATALRDGTLRGVVAAEDAPRDALTSPAFQQR